MVVVAVYLLMEQCVGRGGDYESYGRLAAMSEDNLKFIQHIVEFCKP